VVGQTPGHGTGGEQVARVLLQNRVGAACRILIALSIMFMINVPLPHHRTCLDMVKSSHFAYQPRAIREDAMCVFVTPDGTVYFGNMRIHTEELPDQIRARLRDGSERKVYLTVDARARYGRVAAVVDGVRPAGLRDISFITE
jgi:biopolymer transport protein ExbD